ncbi:phytanoyl-CoA dioxygenase family protein [Aspergillus undulatus]|uniref:phytanoyl-CoA dioxygenase family protein n=1 Tax=Aspergillus undulatus TaxID=1810928 RepID=UPI003CCD12DB
MTSADEPQAVPQIKRFSNTDDRDTIFKALEEEGVVIIKNFLTGEQVSKINRDVDPLVARQREGPSPLKPMEGSLAALLPPQQKRVHNLTGVSKVFRQDILNHELVHDLCRRFFPSTEDYWLLTAAIIDHGPGTPPQVWHRDWLSHPMVRSGPDDPGMLISFFTAMTDFTAESGATEFVSGSHKVVELSPPDAAHPMMLAEMKAGDCFLTSNKMVHRGGANNTTDYYRRGMSLAFMSCVFTPYEATTNLPRKLVESMTPLAQQMIAWRTGRTARERGIGKWTINMNDMAEEMGLKCNQPYDDDDDDDDESQK